MSLAQFAQQLRIDEQNALRNYHLKDAVVVGSGSGAGMLWLGGFLCVNFEVGFDFLPSRVARLSRVRMDATAS